MTNDRLIKVVSGEGCKQLDEKGRGTAVIATLGIPDRDLDIVMPGALAGQTAPLLQSHDWTIPPWGKAAIREEGNEVLADFEINLGTTAGREMREVLLFDMTHPPAKMQWSWGFSISPPDGSEMGELAGQRVRRLKKVILHEVSTVILGSSVNTRTLALKGAVWIPLEVVEKCCPPCVAEMRAKGWTKINLAALKQGFTCPKPFATFQECVDRFRAEPDVADPEAFCAAWEEFCGERVAEAEAEKALALTRKVVQDHWAQRERAIRRPIM